MTDQSIAVPHFPGASSHPVSGTRETSRGDSGATNSESTAARASASGETSPGGTASTGMHPLPFSILH